MINEKTKCDAVTQNLARAYRDELFSYFLPYIYILNIFRHSVTKEKYNNKNNNLRVTEKKSFRHAPSQTPRIANSTAKTEKFPSQTRCVMAISAAWRMVAAW